MNLGVLDGTDSFQLYPFHLLSLPPTSRPDGGGDLLGQFRPRKNPGSKVSRISCRPPRLPTPTPPQRHLGWGAGKLRNWGTRGLGSGGLRGWEELGFEKPEISGTEGLGVWRAGFWGSEELGPERMRDWGAGGLRGWRPGGLGAGFVCHVPILYV